MHIFVLIISSNPKKRENMMRLIFILSLFALSCNKSEQSESAEITIEIEKEINDCLPLDSSNYLVNYEILSLSADSTDALLSGIDKLVAFEDYLYILSKQMRGNEGVFIFRKDGSFVKRLAKGKGRGEFIAAYDILIDKENKQLEVLDRVGFSILRYTLDGKFQSKSSLPRAEYFEFFRLADEEYLLFNSRHNSKKDTAYYFQRIKDGDLVDEYITIPNGARNLLVGFHFFENSHIYCNSTFGNIVYQFNKKTSSLSPYIKMNPILEKGNEKLVKNNRSLLDNEYYYFTNFRIFDDENLLSFNIYKDKLYGLMYDMNSKKTYKRLLSGAPYFTLSIGSDNSGEYFYIFPEGIERLKKYTPKSNQEKEIIDKLSSMNQEDMADSNPYIIYLSYDKKK